MPSAYNNWYIRIYISMLDNIKFNHGREEKGWYVDCLLLLAKCDDEHRGWAYMSGIPLNDYQSARKLEATGEEWKTAKKWLVEDELLSLDSNGVWGIGAERWEEYQGVIERSRLKNRERQRVWREKHAVGKIPATPKY